MNQKQVSQLYYLSKLDNYKNYFELQKNYSLTDIKLEQKRKMAYLFKKTVMLRGLDHLNLKIFGYLMASYQPVKELVFTDFIYYGLVLLNQKNDFEEQNLIHQFFITLLESHKYNYKKYFFVLLYLLQYLSLSNKMENLQKMLESQIYKFENINNPGFYLLCANLLDFGKRFNQEYIDKDYDRTNPFYCIQYCQYLVKKGEIQEAIQFIKQNRNTDHQYLVYQKMFRIYQIVGQRFEIEEIKEISRYLKFDGTLFIDFIGYNIEKDYDGQDQQGRQKYYLGLLKLGFEFMEIEWNCQLKVYGLLLRLLQLLRWKVGEQLFIQTAAISLSNIIDMRIVIRTGNKTDVELKVEILKLIDCKYQYSKYYQLITKCL